MILYRCKQEARAKTNEGVNIGLILLKKKNNRFSKEFKDGKECGANDFKRKNYYRLYKTLF